MSFDGHLLSTFAIEMQAWQRWRWAAAIPGNIVHCNSKSHHAVDTLQESKDAAERIKDGDVTITDPVARQAIDDLRSLVEAALQAPIRFAGEPARPSSISDIRLVTKDVAGRVTAIRAKFAAI
jgi:hypothetical protein